jgi:hypothetical protein
MVLHRPSEPARITGKVPCVEIELGRIRLGGVGLWLGRVPLRFTEKPNRLGRWLLASPLSQNQWHGPAQRLSGPCR